MAVESTFTIPWLMRAQVVSKQAEDEPWITGERWPQIVDRSVIEKRARE
jgi:hypothetical protein